VLPAFCIGITKSAKSFVFREVEQSSVVLESIDQELPNSQRAAIVEIKIPQISEVFVMAFELGIVLVDIR
jgi:hypothetical protein